MTWKDAIIHVLQNNRLNDSYRPMHYRDITDLIIDQKLRDSYGKTPADTVNAQLTTNKNLFESLGEGIYRLTEKGESFADFGKQPQKNGTVNKEENTPLSEIKISKTLIKTYGMFWMRDGVNWNHNPKLLGVQSTGATPVDLSEMRGIYMLYDGREVIYVG